MYTTVYQDIHLTKTIFVRRNRMRKNRRIHIEEVLIDRVEKRIVKHQKKRQPGEKEKNNEANSHYREFD